MTTREEVIEFNHDFGIPMRDKHTTLAPKERLLRGRLLLEEVIEHLTEGLGLQLCYGPLRDGTTLRGMLFEKLSLQIDLGAVYDPIATADGLGDINYIIHGTALTMGIDLDAVTTEIHTSNMSKLDVNGYPIINGVTPGYEGHPDRPDLADPGFRHDLPVGKVIKGPKYREPNIAKIIGEAFDFGQIKSVDEDSCTVCHGLNTSCPEGCVFSYS